MKRQDRSAIRTKKERYILEFILGDPQPSATFERSRLRQVQSLRRTRGGLRGKASVSAPGRNTRREKFPVDLACPIGSSKVGKMKTSCKMTQTQETVPERGKHGKGWWWGGGRMGELIVKSRRLRAFVRHRRAWPSTKIGQSGWQHSTDETKAPNRFGQAWREPPG